MLPARHDDDDDDQLLARQLDILTLSLYYRSFSAVYSSSFKNWIVVKENI